MKSGNPEFDAILACPIGGMLTFAELDMGDEYKVVEVQIARSNEARKFIMAHRVDESGGNGAFWRRVE